MTPLQYDRHKGPEEIPAHSLPAQTGRAGARLWTPNKTGVITRESLQRSLGRQDNQGQLYAPHTTFGPISRKSSLPSIVSGVSSFGSEPGPVSEVPHIAVWPGGFTHKCREGTDATSLGLLIWNSGSGQMTYSVSDDRFWLDVTPYNGVSWGNQNYHRLDFYTKSLTVTGSPYLAYITITSPEADNSPVRVPVLLHVYIIEPPPPDPPPTQWSVWRDGEMVWVGGGSSWSTCDLWDAHTGLGFAAIVCGSTGNMEASGEGAISVPGTSIDFNLGTPPIHGGTSCSHDIFNQSIMHYCNASDDVSMEPYPYHIGAYHSINGTPLTPEGYCNVMIEVGFKGSFGGPYKVQFGGNVAWSAYDQAYISSNYAYVRDSNDNMVCDFREGFINSYGSSASWWLILG